VGKTVKNRVPRFLAIYYGGLLIWLTTTAMHIPDGYLSPITSAILFLIVLPFWMLGIRKLRQRMDARSVPLIALLSAFSFVIMMFNIPIPGGTTAHAVGASLAAIILGPEIATIAISMALIIQAFFFGDGGILAIGANCFNMAVVISYLSYAIYRLFAANTDIRSSKRLVGAAIGGWTGVTIAAFFAGVEFGIQPLLFKAANGSPLYAPYPLSIAIPAMVIPHALVASVVEAILTVLVLAYLQRTNPGILEAAEKPVQPVGIGGVGKLRWLWITLAVLVVASPLGLLAPGTAWGEWGVQELSDMGLKAIPQGLVQFSGIWGAPFKGYDLPSLGNSSLGYIFSAFSGILIVGIMVWSFTRLLTAARPAHKRQNVLEHAIQDISGVLERSLFAEEISSQPGLLQSLDPRVKVACVLAFLIGVSLSKSLVVIAAIYLFVLWLAWRSSIPAGFFIRRVWLFLPFFTGVLLIPALFITPGPALLSLPFGLVVTQTGVITDLFLLLRVSTSVSLTLLLILTTPWNTVLSALSFMHVPDVFILMLGMTYRYIYLLLHITNDMFLSRQSRVVGRLTGADERHIIAATTATLLSKSLNLSSEVYLAMQSRGFRGRVVTLKPFQMKTRDWVWCGVLLSICVAAIVLGR
jgi:cobalt/nickel transport system permease protein